MVFISSPTNSLSAQSKFSYGFQAGYVVNGFLEKANLQTGADIDRINPGPSFLLGMKHYYYFDHQRKFSIGTGILYEFSGFTKVSKENYRVGSSFKLKHQYRIQQVNVPLDINYRIKKFTLSIGLVYTSLLSIKNTQQSCYKASSDAACVQAAKQVVEFRINEQKKIGGPLPFSTSDQIYIDNRSNLQIKWGLHYYLNEQLKIGLAYRDFLFKNNLYTTHFDYDLFTNTTYEFQTTAIDFNIIYTLAQTNTTEPIKEGLD